MKVFTAICVLVMCCTYVNSQVLPGWNLVWNDEFSGTSLDLTKWNYEVDCWGGGNGELQCYTARPANSYVQDGKLYIVAKPERYTGSAAGCTNNNENSCGNTKDYTSAKLTTRHDPKGSWKYGRMEIRAKIPKGPFLWPAIWMLPTDSVYGQWAASGEIDIMESMGQDTTHIVSTLHYGSPYPNNVHYGSGFLNFGYDFSADFHTYTLEWEEKEMRFYVDNTLYFTVNLDKNWYSGHGPNPYTKNGQPWDQRMFMLLNLAIGGGFFGAEMGKLTAQQAAAWANPVLAVDYVRVYEKVISQPTTTTSPTSSSTSSSTTSPTSSSTSSSTTSSTSSSSSATSASPTTSSGTSSAPVTSSSSDTPITDQGEKVGTNQDGAYPINTNPDTGLFGNASNFVNFIVGSVVTALALLIITASLMIFVTIRAWRWMRDNGPITGMSLSRV
jgi:beta-glucanase (GH16 family)